MKSSFKELEDKEREEKVKIAEAFSSGLMGICQKCFAPVELGSECPFCDKKDKRELDEWDKAVIKNFPEVKLACFNCNEKIDPQLKYCPKCKIMI